ncbi:MAG: hypothetical protein DMG21_03500 [Acidobacteria bacterium]|nr:MAG: hypothetical protein DMG21_03500 [Acidobacteriota bacterium]
MSANRAVYIASGIVIPLTFLYYQSAGSSNLLRTAILFFPLFPGKFAEMLIAGEHGGTWPEDTIAEVIGTAVKIGAYSLLVLGGNRLFRRLTSK